MSDEFSVGRNCKHRFNGMDVLVLPDDHEFLKDIKPGCIGSDGVRFYVGETFWSDIKDKLIKVSRDDK